MKRNARLLVIFLCFCFLFVSCDAKNTNVLSVVSHDYSWLKELHSGEFDEDLARVWTQNENPHRENHCYVTVEDGTICVNNKSDISTTYLMQFNYGYFIGVNLGEHDGWVKFHKYNSNVTSNGEGILVANENCCGIIKNDMYSGYLLTVDYWELSDLTGRIYAIQTSQESKTWEWVKLASFEGYPYNCLASQEDECIYIVTDRSIISVSFTGSVNTIIQSDLLRKIGANSIVILDDIFYCGSPMGVYCYDKNSGIETWYPMDYNKYAP